MNYHLYNSVKCLVFPSFCEGFGIPVLEAQRADCPVSAYNSSSIPEEIGPLPLIMQELSKEGLLIKISMLDDGDKRRDIIVHGLDNPKRFSWDKTYVYKKQYNDLLGGCKFQEISCWGVVCSLLCSNINLLELGERRVA